MGNIRIVRLRHHPGKGMRGYDADHLMLGPAGPIDDRLMMVVTPSGRLISPRTHPRLVRVVPQLFGLGAPSCPAGVTFTSGTCQYTHVRDPRGLLVEVKIHKDRTRGIDQGDDVADWFSQVLDTDCRLVWLPVDNFRRVDARFASPTDLVGFADGWPLLVAGRASFEHFNGLLAPTPITEDRLRPTVVLGGTAPYEEDTFLVLEVVGRDVILFLDKLNARCTVINVDPITAAVAPEPLDMLVSYRQMAEPSTGIYGAMFGVNARSNVGQHPKLIAVGDEVKVLKRR